MSTLMEAPSRELNHSSRQLFLSDLLRLSSVGLRTRKLRAALSALGITIGVAAIVAVLGLSQSAESGLLAEIDSLGTNMLTVSNGQTLFGQQAELPTQAPAIVRHISGVTAVQYTGQVSNIDTYRSPLIPSIDTNALTVQATSLGLLSDIRDTLAQGQFLNAATDREPDVVLGALAAQRLGIDRVFNGERVWLDNQWFYVVGILNQAVYAPDVDSSVLVGFPTAEADLGFDGHPSKIYVRTEVNQTAAVQPLLATAANPEDPSQVSVSQPSEALLARAATQSALNGLFLGLGAVALLVGAIGVANIMVISVLERRSEIGLRRALGATRGHIRMQFLSEAVLLSMIGGALGVGVGAAAVAIYTYLKAEATVIPTQAWAGGIGAAIAIGAIAGLLPALRAARMSPTQALWSI
ncbi:MAG TPA: ABC transporter permease [Streptosporangiaceae bacterium]